MFNLIFDLPGPLRLDKFLSQHPDLHGFSRGEIQAAILSGQVQIDGKEIKKTSYKVRPGERLDIQIEKKTLLEDQPEAIPLRIVYEDESLLVINKPPGLTVHPGAGQKNGTLLNALLHHHPSLVCLPRAGIVHRLDKDTAGLMVVAKTSEARLHLINQLKHHQVERCYVALVRGTLISGQTLSAPIGRHPIHRTKMAVLLHSAQAKEAMTHIRIRQRFKRTTLIEARLETGRTHQIRVHLAYLGHPLIGDRVYGRPDPKLGFSRQALQAYSLSFTHPLTCKKMEFAVEWETDFQALIQTVEGSDA